MEAKDFLVIFVSNCPSFKTKAFFIPLLSKRKQNMLGGFGQNELKFHIWASTLSLKQMWEGGESPILIYQIP